MKKSKEQIGNDIVNELEDALESINSSTQMKVIEVDTAEKTVTIVFTYHEVPEDNYTGLCCY